MFKMSSRGEGFLISCVLLLVALEFNFNATSSIEVFFALSVLFRPRSLRDFLLFLPFLLPDSLLVLDVLLLLPPRPKSLPRKPRRFCFGSSSFSSVSSSESSLSTATTFLWDGATTGAWSVGASSIVLASETVAEPDTAIGAWTGSSIFDDEGAMASKKTSLSSSSLVRGTSGTLRSGAMGESYCGKPNASDLVPLMVPNPFSLLAAAPAAFFFFDEGDGAEVGKAFWTPSKSINPSSEMLPLKDGEKATDCGSAKESPNVCDGFLPG
mmetsp:Transcript_36216/g.87142  ORF Transcript_36216/g.87142 Transcript_36216/m.87142 type:complete len:268 (-) Transcript_36216:2425-3228(-)